MKFLVKSIVSISLAMSIVFLTGCGGGGSSDNSASVTGSTTLSGVAVDDLILNGIVEVRSNSANGPLIATTRTDSQNGTYSVNLDNFSGVTVVTVKCDENTTIKNSDGNIAECPNNLQLRSAVSVDTGVSSVTANISPLTEILFALATEGNETKEIDPTTLQQAREKIAVAFKVDPIAENPVEDEEYKTIVTSFHKVADDQNLSIIDVIDDIAKDADDGVFGDDNLTNALALALKENNIITPLVTAVDSNETYTPVANPADTTDIELAKTFFENLRTQAVDFIGNDTNMSFFDIESYQLSSAIQNLSVNTDVIANITGVLVNGVLTGINNNLTEVNLTIYQNFDASSSRTAILSRTDINATNWSYTITDNIDGNSAESGSGTITIPNLTNFDPNNFTNLTFSFDGTIPQDVLTANSDSGSFKADISLTRNADGTSLDINNISFTTANNDTLGIKSLFATLGYDYNASNTTEPFSLNYIKLEQIELAGDIGGNVPYSANGKLTIDYTQNQVMLQKGGINEVYTTDIGGSVYCYDTNGSYIQPYTNAPVTIDINGKVYNVYTNQYGWFETTLNGEYYYDDLINQFTFDQTVCPSGSNAQLSLNFTHTYSDIEGGNSGWIPSKMVFEGNLTNNLTNSTLSGKVAVELLNAATIDVYNNETPQIQLTISGVLERPQFDTLYLDLKYKNDPIKVETQNMFNLSYVYGNTSVNLDAILDKDMNNGTVSLSSGSGLKNDIAIANGDIDFDKTTPLTKDGSVIGELDNALGVPRIKYVDGTFETLQ